jgi:MoxR-like ATPase
MLSGRALVLPEDVQSVAPAVVGHRLRAILNKGGSSKSIDPAQDLLQSVPIP